MKATAEEFDGSKVLIHNFVGRSPRKPHQHAVAHLRSLGGDAGGASHYIPAYLGISRYISVYLGSFFLFAGIASAGGLVRCFMFRVEPFTLPQIPIVLDAL